MSRNDERLPGSPESSPVVSAGLNLDFPMPTEFVDLPSEGKFYPEGHPLHGKDTIEIKYMTAKDEDILTSKSLIKKGLAVDRFLQNILVDKNIKVDDLVVSDRNALVIAARITGYGANYETKVICPSCETPQKYEFDLSELKTTKGELDQLEAKLTEKNTILITLPKTEWVVEVRLMTGVDEKWLASTAEKKRKHKLTESAMTDQLKRVTVSIQGVTDQATIAKAIDRMPAIDSKYLRVAYKKVVPNIDATQTFVCEKCDAEQEVSLPFSADFFWPDR